MDQKQIEESVTHPRHYAGVTVEPINLAECFGFLLGNAVKYLYRAGKKEGSSEEMDLRKAKFYLERWLDTYVQEMPNLCVIQTGSTDEDARHLAAYITLLTRRNVYLRTLFGEFIGAGRAGGYHAVFRTDVAETLKFIDLELEAE